MARPKEFDPDRALEKAIDMFWCQGYEATTMQDLVDAMGINRQSIYDTFGDKHALFVTALQHYGDVQIASIVQTLESPGSAKAAIRQLFSNIVDRRSHSQSYNGCMMVNSTVELAARDPAIERQANNDVVRTEEVFYNALLRAREGGEISPQRNLKELARFLNNSLRGLQVMAKATSDLAMLQDIVNVTLSVLN